MVGGVWVVMSYCYDEIYCNEIQIWHNMSVRMGFGMTSCIDRGFGDDVIDVLGI